MTITQRQRSSHLRRLPKSKFLFLTVENQGFEAFEKPAEILTPYVFGFRYPGGADELMPSREEFDEALQHAQVIYDFVLNLLPTEARP